MRTLLVGACPSHDGAVMEFNKNLKAPLTQLVECRHDMAKVVGSSPTGCTSFFTSITNDYDKIKK